MSAPHRPPDHRSGWVFDTRELGRRAGALKIVQTTVPAPAGLRVGVIGVPEGSPVELDLRLESVVEGVLVTGTAMVTVQGECVRCLTELTDELVVDLQELFVHPSSEATEDEASRLQGDLLDLEPLLRDEVVLELPFRPLCREDCAGLCVQCGADLNAEPDHGHAPTTDTRWEQLLHLEVVHDSTYDKTSSPGGTA